MEKRMHVAVLGLLLCALSSCAALSPEKPTVTITDVELAVDPFTGIHGTLSMDVFNPNSFGLPLSKIDWKLSLGASGAVQGSIALSETILAKESSPITAKFHIGTMQAVGIARELASGTRDYTVQGRFYFQGKLGELYVDVSHQGRIE